MKTIQSKQEKREEKKLVLATKRRAKAEEKLKATNPDDKKRQSKRSVQVEVAKRKETIQQQKFQRALKNNPSTPKKTKKR